MLLRMCPLWIFFLSFIQLTYSLLCLKAMTTWIRRYITPFPFCTIRSRFKLTTDFM